MHAAISDSTVLAGPVYLATSIYGDGAMSRQTYKDSCAGALEQILDFNCHQAISPNAVINATGNERTRNQS